MPASKIKKPGNPVTAIARVSHVKRAPKNGRGLLILANIDVALLREQAETIGLLSIPPEAEFPNLTSRTVTITPAQRKNLEGAWNFLHAALDKLEHRV